MCAMCVQEKSINIFLGLLNFQKFMIDVAVQVWFYGNVKAFTIHIFGWLHHICQWRSSGRGNAIRFLEFQKYWAKFTQLCQSSSFANIFLCVPNPFSFGTLFFFFALVSLRLSLSPFLSSVLSIFSIPLESPSHIKSNIMYLLGNKWACSGSRLCVWVKSYREHFVDAHKWMEKEDTISNLIAVYDYNISIFSFHPHSVRLRHFNTGT